MNARLAILALSALTFACNDQPPMIGGGDAGSDARVTDATAPNDAAGDAPSDAGGNPDSSGTCTLNSPPQNPTCASCVQSTCCSTWNACVANADCTGYVACVRVCYADSGAADAGPPNPDAGFDGGGGEGSGFACAKGCMKKFPNGINDGIVIVDCEDNGCAGKCP